MAGVSFVSRGTNRGRRFCENCTSNYANQCILDPSVSVAFGAIIDDDEFALMRQMISFLRSLSIVFGHRPLSSYKTTSVGPLLGRSSRPTTPRSRPLSAPCRRDYVVDTAEQQNDCSWLVVGDGDLSYSAELARTLSNNSTTNIRLIASVLEREETISMRLNWKRTFHHIRYVVSYSTFLIGGVNPTFDTIESWLKTFYGRQVK
jgi:hypothetical protein